MPDFFPRRTVELLREEPKALRRFSYSVWEMAIVTGVLVRVYRLAVLTHGSDNWLYIGGTFAIGTALLLGMLTLHLANYPLHQYLWRAPAFAGIEVGVEMAVSAALIALHREPNGTVRAHWADWPSMGVHALLARGIAIMLWGLVLAAAVQIVRHTIVHEDDDDLEQPAV